MRFKHTCLDGEDRRGQELDCPVCRALLLEAFRGADRPVDRTGLFLALPSVPSTDPFGPDPVPPPGPSRHVVRCRTNAYFGIWAVVCSCGWGTNGIFSAGEEALGRAWAEKTGLNHVMSQEENL